jgi:hypothetical protein
VLAGLRETISTHLLQQKACHLPQAGYRVLMLRQLPLVVGLRQQGLGLSSTLTAGPGVNTPATEPRGVVGLPEMHSS